ncbi:hypothetical protein SAMN04488241_10216 [Sphingomonas rubra]|uniref:Glyoxalase-like domain-containing protein n=1 Tax=Sphingomonas rubra TaxID=634430 RepID=A0A1I5QFU4_9SPHN|nr:hypothetical protein SAMN04488241_10216 [Sphingomonas rubra]
MSDVPSIGAFAIVPSNDHEAATVFWKRLGFKRARGIDDYVIMEDWGCEVHLTQAGPREWRVRASARWRVLGAPGTMTRTFEGASEDI